MGQKIETEFFIFFLVFLVLFLFKEKKNTRFQIQSKTKFFERFPSGVISVFAFLTKGGVEVSLPFLPAAQATSAHSSARNKLRGSAENIFGAKKTQYKHQRERGIKLVNADLRSPCASQFSLSQLALSGWMCSEVQRTVLRSRPLAARALTASPPISRSLRIETHSCGLMSPFPSHSKQTHPIASQRPLMNHKQGTVLFKIWEVIKR